MKHGVFITPEYAALARKTDAARAELVMKYGNFFDFFPGQYETDPQYIEYDNDMKKLFKLDEERRRKESTHYCEKCGDELIAGENYFTMRPDHICTKCRPYEGDCRGKSKGAELVLSTLAHMNLPI